MSEQKYQVGDLQVWWIPQLGMRGCFEVSVASVEEGVKLMTVFADYDLFQVKHNIKPDYSNVGGLRRWCSDSDGEGTPGWEDWFDEETGIDDPAAYLEAERAQ
jgi:hypothetical protein